MSVRTIIHYIASSTLFFATAIVIGLTLSAATSPLALLAATLLAGLSITLGIMAANQAYDEYVSSLES
jgi:4-hydroxybenzoate polyprenyltransferase